FNNMKIDRAKELIREGNMNFTEIAHFLSYSSLQYFSKQFKK
ncbi:MAG TPA: AraC family transcriptional regulator, partial [Lachnospiraceae bacterium]|nr:AraC family transcriptional regulator [Lachnospiraceae bacterium]